MRITIPAELAGGRLDEATAAAFDIVSKSEARRIIDRGGCAVNRSMVRVASRIVRQGDEIEIGVMEQGRFHELALPPESLLYEDSDLIAVNKPAGINSQRTPYQLKGTLEYWVSEYFRRNNINEPARIIHRLDRGTSGVMLFPRHKRSAAWLSARFHDGEIDKRYLALVDGVPPQSEWRVDLPIGKTGSGRYGFVSGGRSAVTIFHLISSNEKTSLVEARPLTGRTHQIRVHLASSGYPITGDTIYGGQSAERMMLHCSEVLFRNDRDVEIKIKAPHEPLFNL